jgi:FKBP-type peptidyl-prolyl cis-trans isomerase
MIFHATRLVVLAALISVLPARGISASEEVGKDDGSRKEKVSYSLGYKAGSQMKGRAVDLDPDVYKRAFGEGFAGDKAAMTEKEMSDALATLRKEMDAGQAKKKKLSAKEWKRLASRNRKEGEIFLAENARKEGVVTLPSGLQYKVIKDGTGRRPGGTDKVAVRYRGTLIDGTGIGSAGETGQPAVVAVDNTLKGLGEALQLMPEGSKWMLYVPSRLAYAMRSPTNKVGPNRTLIFEVELLSVQ